MTKPIMVWKTSCLVNCCAPLIEVKIFNKWLLKLHGLSLLSELQILDLFTDFLALVDIRAFGHWFFLASQFFYTLGVFVLHINTFCKHLVINILTMILLAISM